VCDETVGDGAGQTGRLPLAVPIREAAHRLGTGRDATYALVRSRRLKTIRVGGRQLVPLVELAAFIERELASNGGLRPE
jgi:excisionase family DNA binding protein